MMCWQQPSELLFSEKIELLSKALLHCVTPNSNTLIGIIGWTLVCKNHFLFITFGCGGVDVGSLLSSFLCNNTLALKTPPTRESFGVIWEEPHQEYWVRKFTLPCRTTVWGTRPPHGVSYWHWNRSGGFPRTSVPLCCKRKIHQQKHTGASTSACSSHKVCVLLGDHQD